MKIRTQFILITVFFGAMALGIAASVVVTNEQVENTTAQKKVADKLEQQANELSYLSSADILYPDNLQFRRWKTKYASFSNDLMRLKPATPEQRVLVDDLKTDVKRLGTVFAETRKVLTISERQDQALGTAFLQTSWSRTQIQNQALIFDTARLAQILEDRRDELKQTNNRLIFILIGAFGAFLLVNYVLTYRRTLVSIGLLHEGTKIIGSGNLDFAIPRKSNDEIGELSDAFNRMTSDLKSITASKAELEREIAERQLAEAALAAERERLAVTLASIGDGVIATDVEANVVLLNGVAQQLTGWTLEAATGKPLTEVFNIVNEKTGRPAEDPVDKALKTGTVVGLANHTVLIAKDGARRPIADSCAPIKSEDGSIIGAVLVFRDVTEQYEAEKLREAHNRANAAISSTLDFDTIMRTVVVQAAEAVGCDSTSIEMRRDGYWEICHLHGLPEEMIGMRFSFEETKELEIVTGTHEPFFVSGKAVGDMLAKKVIGAFNIQAMMLMPIIVKDDVVGALRFVDRSPSATFTEGQVDFAQKLAVSVSLALENARLYAAEHHIAQTLQEALLSVPQALPGIQFGHLYRSATEAAKVGGDFYDIFPIEPGKIGVLMGDVAGKGVTAATLTVLVQHTIKAFAHQRYSPAEILSRTNDVLTRETPDGTFVTVFFCIVDTQTGTLTYCSAGHPSAVLKRRTGVTELLTSASPVLGIFGDLSFSESETLLEGSDTLLLYTDGITEARDADREFFGEKRLLETVGGPTSDADLTEHIFKRIMDFTGGNLADDLAILSMSLLHEENG